jgi:hypothetical protein
MNDECNEASRKNQIMHIVLIHEMMNYLFDLQFEGIQTICHAISRYD